MTQPYYRPSYDEFKGVFDLLALTLISHRVQDSVAGPAVMALAAHYAAFADMTDDEIVTEFRKCILDARTRALQNRPAN